jgi:hypothetical protein
MDMDLSIRDGLKATCPAIFARLLRELGETTDWGLEAYWDIPVRPKWGTPPNQRVSDRNIHHRAGALPLGIRYRSSLLGLLGLLTLLSLLRLLVLHLLGLGRIVGSYACPRLLARLARLARLALLRLARKLQLLRGTGCGTDCGGNHDGSFVTD